MSTIQFKPFSVFTAPRDESKTSLQAIGNSASVALFKHLPTEDECCRLSQQHPDTTLVFISPIEEHANHFSIAWFKTGRRIQRCGHGTLAAAYFLQSDAHALVFQSTREQLLVTLKQQHASLHLIPETLIKLTQQPLTQAKRSMVSQADNGYMIIELDNQQAVKDFTLDNNVIAALGARALIISSLSDYANIDITFRYFAPQYGVVEDQATGSAASCLWPFWSSRIDKDCLNCYQLSAQGGYFSLTAPDSHVVVTGYITEK